MRTRDGKKNSMRIRIGRQTFSLAKRTCVDVSTEFFDVEWVVAISEG